MCNRLGTIPTCDRQTDRRTSCHGIVCAMHTRRAVKTLKLKLWHQCLTAQRYCIHVLTKLRFWYRVIAQAFSHLWTKRKILIHYRNEENDFIEAVHLIWVDAQRRYVHFTLPRRKKLDWCGYPTLKNIWSLFVLTEFMNVMDRQTDTALWHKSRLCGKNTKPIVG